MSESKLLYKVEPQYPPLAVEHPMQGTVRFLATLARDGHIEGVQLISGHPLLVRAAKIAALQWIYRPTLLGGSPVRVITQIEVRFNLPPDRGQPDTRRAPNRLIPVLL